MLFWDDDCIADNVVVSTGWDVAAPIVVEADWSEADIADAKLDCIETGTVDVELGRDGFDVPCTGWDVAGPVVVDVDCSEVDAADA